MGYLVPPMPTVIEKQIPNHTHSIERVKCDWCGTLHIANNDRTRCPQCGGTMQGQLIQIGGAR